MLEYIKKQKLNKVIFTNPSRLYRNLSFWLDFKKQCEEYEVENFSVDNSLVELEKKNQIIKEDIYNTYKQIENEEKMFEYNNNKF